MKKSINLNWLVAGRAMLVLLAALILTSSTAKLTIGMARSKPRLDAARPECAPTAGSLEYSDDAGHAKDDTQPGRNAECKPRSDKQCERGEAAQDPAFGTDVR